MPMAFLWKERALKPPKGTVIANGTSDYIITAAGATPNLAGRSHLYPPLENMPQIIYLGDEVGESELFEALAEGSIDAIARGEIGNRDATYATGDAFVVTALDDQVEFGRVYPCIGRCSTDDMY